MDFQIFLKIGQQLESVRLHDLPIPSVGREESMYDVDTVYRIPTRFLERVDEKDEDNGYDTDFTGHHHGSLLKVGRIRNAYLAEIARDPYLSLQKFTAIIERHYNRLTRSRITEIKLNINANHNNTSLNRDEKQRRLETETSEAKLRPGKMEGTAGASQLPRVREKGGSNLEAGYLQLPASQRIANHSANHKHELTNQPDIDIHQRHEAVGLSDDAVVRFKTRRLPPSRPSPGPYTPVEPRAYIEQADRTAHHLWSSLNRVREKTESLTENLPPSEPTSKPCLQLASKPPVTRRWPKQHHALPPEQPQSRRETHPLKDSTHFPRRPPEETKTERITRVASNPDLRPRGLPDEPRAAKPKSLTRSKKKIS
ncbi:unnamed protein product [Brassica napus]|uniref:(rape) hypothetical protein n=1 Tax=Brassica napus TaxID=3708 RepID=A0A816ZS88_BRANA|nr:unnamed protein product [Brassica napus]